MLIVQEFPVHSQVILDNKGKDFYLAFLPNYHNRWGLQDTLINKADSIFIFIASEKPCSGKIEYFDINGKPYSHDFAIGRPYQFYTFRLSYYNFALRGFNFEGKSNRNNSEVASRLTFHVSSTEDVSVFAHFQSINSSESCMVLPVDALEREYYVMAYNSDKNTPSQFGIVAIENNTKITIKPSVPTRYNQLQEQHIDLNKGEVYLVQADITKDPHYDLTGSYIFASKPVAVFAGEQRCQIPYEDDYYYPTRDYILEQMLPASCWGENAFLNPFVQPPGVTEKGYDLYRVISSTDNNSVFVNNKLKKILNKGEFFQDTLSDAIYIRATGPIMAAQYKKTSRDSTPYTVISDPLMLVIPPKEQFLDNYLVMNIQAYQLENFRDSLYSLPVYEKHYINVTVPDDAVSSLTTDGNPVKAGLFEKIANTGYSQANLPVSEGVHFLECDKPFGIFIYGYGVMNSYGYTGGLQLERISFVPPDIILSDTCFGINGRIISPDDSISRINEVLSPDSLNQNTNVIINKEPGPVKTAYIESFLKDIRQDGHFSLIINYGKNKTIREDHEIPGFTISVAGMLPSDIPLVEDSLPLNKSHCFDIIIHNYGKFEQELTDAFTDENSKYTVLFEGIKKVAPGADDTITVCFKSDSTGIFKSRLFLRNICSSIPLADFSVKISDDESPPQFSIKTDSCRSNIKISFSENENLDRGFEKLNYDILQNLALVNENISVSAIYLELEINDPYKDAYYNITVEDSAGNKTSVSDTIPGFTLSVARLSDKSDYSFGEHYIGGVYCGSLKLTNYGLFPITIENPYVIQSTAFSLPRSQFPITINPDETKFLMVCFSPHSITPETLTDTILLYSNCTVMRIPLSGSGMQLTGYGNNRCNIPVRIILEKIPGEFYLVTGYPNPSSDYTRIIFGVPETKRLSLCIYNMTGEKIKEYFSKVFQPGLYEYELNTSDLANGMYIYRLYGESVNKTGKLQIMK